MRSVGIDIAKISINACGLAVDGEPRKVTMWKSPPRLSMPELLSLYEKWLIRQFWMMKPDVVAVERLMGFSNRQVIREIAQLEGVALLTAAKTGAIVLNPPVGQSRNIALGVAPSVKKEVAFEAFKKKYPNFKLANKGQGGEDEADAMVHALAAPTHLQRAK